MTQPAMFDRLGPISLGTSGIAGLYHEVSYSEAMDVLSAAWELGIRYFDTAPHYGQGLAERRLGDFLRDNRLYPLHEGRPSPDASHGTQDVSQRLY